MDFVCEFVISNQKLNVSASIFYTNVYIYYPTLIQYGPYLQYLFFLSSHECTSCSCIEFNSCLLSSSNTKLYISFQWEIIFLASKMAHLMKALLSNLTYYLCSISGTYNVKREIWLLQIILWSPHQCCKKQKLLLKIHTVLCY